MVAVTLCALYGFLMATFKFNQSAEKTTQYFRILAIRATEATDETVFICRHGNPRIPVCEDFSLSHDARECGLGGAWTERRPLGYVLDRYTSRFVTTASAEDLIHTIAESTEMTEQSHPEVYERLLS